MVTTRLISTISRAAQIARQLDRLHQQGIVYGPLIPSRLSAHGWLLSSIPAIDLQTIDLERIAHSPQETLSHSAAPGSASDLYSLGVVLDRQLAGQLPFNDLDPLKLVHEIFMSEPQPPHEILPQIPVPLSLLIVELLAKLADERPQSAGEIAAILETFAECLQAGAPRALLFDWNAQSGILLLASRFRFRKLCQ